MNSLKMQNDFENYIKDYFKDFKDSTLKEAMLYALMGSGKRFRPRLIFSIESDEKKAFPCALALELIHNYSLVHDDLPCMDDDDYRRGRLSTHKKYGEAMAVLVGDALLTESFKVLALNFMGSELSKLVAILSTYAGAKGMVYGQYLDLKYEGQKTIGYDVVKKIDYYKTACLFIAALKMVMILKNDEAHEELYQKLGEKIGILFQIQDDLFDIIRTKEETGKPQNSDLKKGKITALRFKSTLEIQKLLDEEFSATFELIKGFDFDTNGLKELITSLKER